MKNIFRNIFMASLVVAGSAYLASCSKDSEVENIIDEVEDVTTPGTEEEDGYFIATLSSGLYNPITRAAISGKSSRVQSLRYIIYKKDQNGVYQYYTGAAGNDKYLFGENGTISGPIDWPYTPLSVKLENGEYKVVFLGNMNEKQFVNGENKNDSIVTNYKGKYSASRINLPTVKGFYEEAVSDGGEGKTSNFFYWDTVEVSTSNPNAEVLLQRIVSKFEMSREILSTEDGSNARVALTSTLTKNIFDYLEGDGTITRLIGGQIGDITRGVFVDLGINALEKMLIDPIVNALINGLEDTKIIEALTSQIDGVLKGNEKYDTNLLDLNAVLNPWGYDAEHAIVAFDKYTKSVDLDNKPVDYFVSSENEIPRFAYTVNPNGTVGPRTYLQIYGLNGEWKIKRIDATDKNNGEVPDLISGQIIDNFVDGWLIDGCVHDAAADLTYNFGANNPYHSVFSDVTLNMYPKEFVKDKNGDLSVTVNLGNVLSLKNILDGTLTNIEQDENKKAHDYKNEIDELQNSKTTVGAFVKATLSGLLGTVGDLLDFLTGKTVGYILNNVLYPALEDAKLGGKEGLVKKLVDNLNKDITITLPINISLLNTDNLEVSGGWTRVYYGELPEIQ